MIREMLQGIAGYPGLFLACLGSGLVVPLPEDFPLLYAGMRLATGEFGLVVLPIALLGVGCRDVIAWGLGRLLGNALLHRPLVQRFLGAQRLERARELVVDHGASAVLLGRFLIGFRAPMFLVAGATGVRLRAFLLYDGIGLLLVVPVTLALGWGFGEPLAESVFWLLQRARLGIGLVVCAAGLALLWRSLGSRPESVGSCDPPGPVEPDEPCDPTESPGDTTR